LSTAPSTDQPRFAEFVALMATLMSLVALSIDAMLPALGEIGRDLQAPRANDVQLVVALIFAGMSVGQLAYGPLSDSVGRKPALLAGLALYMGGCVVSMAARSFSVMLVGRLIQGLGVAAPRVISIALIRDRYEGRRMARVMSFIMAVFITVPIVAPSLGQGLLLVASWRAIFGAFLVIAVAASAWFTLRQPETLAAERRIPFSPSRVAAGFAAVVRIRSALGYTVAAGLVFGAFVGYLSTAQQVFQELYGLGSRFPLYFAALAMALGVASLLNTRLVMRFGMRPLVRTALWAIAALSGAWLVPVYVSGGQPPLWSLMAYLLAVFLCEGTLYGNMTALAMEPLGHLAGVGSAVVGALSLFISMLGGTIIGRAYDGSVVHLVAGFGVLALAALAVTWWTEAGPELSQEATRAGR
jgi:DHA1 family bicyclomycin/chloramphenicol resistance-like MFS transporter